MTQKSCHNEFPMTQARTNGTSLLVIGWLSQRGCVVETIFLLRTFSGILGHAARIVSTAPSN
jgi:hypothetical protein